MMFGDHSRARTARSVVEDVDQERTQLERHVVAVGDRLEQADVLLHEVHREVDVARAVEDYLAFGFVHERVSARDPDRLVRRVEVHSGCGCSGERLGERHEIRGRQVVRQHLEDRRRAELARVEDASSQRRENRQDPLERRPFATGEDGDVAGRRPMAAARNGTIDGFGAHRFDELAEPDHFRLVGRRHLQPDLAGPKPARSPSSSSSTAAEAAGEGRQVITTSHSSAITLGDSPHDAPASSRWLAASLLRSRTTTSRPFRTSEPASFPPTFPNPMNPTFMVRPPLDDE